MAVYEYCSPICTLFGSGCSAGIAVKIKENGWKKGLIVTDSFLITAKAGQAITRILEENQIAYAVYTGVQPNPTVRNIRDGLKAFQEEGCDFLISIGGGSAHDCAKGIAIVGSNGGDVKEYRGVNKSKKPAVPFIAVNTTAGTGSECTRAYVVLDEETQEKYGNKDIHALPALSVDDHELMMEIPERLTAGTGMDALTHAVESYLSVNGFLLTKELAIGAVRLVFQHLSGAVLSPNEKNREGMAVAQYMAGLSFGSAGCGLVHSMSHQLSAVYNLPHGLCNALLLPSVCRFNMGSEKGLSGYVSLAEAVFPCETQGMTAKEKASFLIDRIEALSEKIGTHVKLETLGVRKEDFELLAEKTLKDLSLGNNPLKPSKEEVVKLYAGVY